MGGLWCLAVGLLLVNQVWSFNYRKYFQAFQHEAESELVRDFQPDVESDEFSLDYVVSGRDARTMRQVSALNEDSSLAFDLSLLQIPEEVPPKLPSHKIKFTSGFASMLESYVADPSSLDDPYQKVKTMPGLMPRPDDHETITNFAMMCSNAYIIHSILGDWRNMTDYEQVQSIIILPWYKS